MFRMNGVLSIKTGSKDPTIHQEATRHPSGSLAAAGWIANLNRENIKQTDTTQ